MPNFADISSKKVSEIERPPMAPLGTYQFRVTKLPATTKSADEAWEFLRFNCKVVQPMENVEVDDYPGDVSNIMLSKSFVFNTQDQAEFDKTLFSLRTFLEKHIKCGDGDMSVAELLNASVNGEFLGDVKRTQDKRDESGETFNEEIGRTAPLD